MDYFLTEDQTSLRDLVRQIAEEQVKPVRAKYDLEGTFPWDVVKIFAEAGLFSVVVPEEYGGMGMGVFELALMTEELSRVCGGIALSVAASALGTFPILISGNEEQKKRYLPNLAVGQAPRRLLPDRTGRGQRRGFDGRRAPKRRATNIS